mmetsp:Transcript_33252/g.87961  ORF Transcript_33252/g.87961 Transcript_33252/m.87961 type:complete len:201 (-) Transcript_33252:442-1044(-)
MLSNVLSSSSKSAVSLVSFSMPFVSVARKRTLSLASSRASSTSFWSREKGVVYVLLLVSRNLRTFFRLSMPSWEWMAFRFVDLFFQNCSSALGSAFLPSLRSISGSCLRTWRICFVHVMTAPSRTCTRSLLPAAAVAPPPPPPPLMGSASLGGCGSSVWPFMRPTVTCRLARKTWYLSMRSLAMRSDQPLWFAGFISVDR